MSYPFAVHPCCYPLDCHSDAPGHEQPVKIEIAYAGKPSKGPTAGGIFCHADSAWNHAFLLPAVDEDGSRPLHGREKTLHVAVLAVQRIGTFLAENPHESAVGPSAIREIHLGVQSWSFVRWYGKGPRRSGMTPRVVGLLRDLEDAAAWVGEQGEYRPVVTFFSSVSFKGSEALELAFALHKSLLSSIEEGEEGEEEEEVTSSFSLPIR